MVNILLLHNLDLQFRRYSTVCLLVDLTAVCLLEGFNNPDWMVHADRVLKSIGKEKAQEFFKVCELSHY